MALASPQSIRVEAVTDEQLLTKVGYVKFSSRLSAYALIDEEDLFHQVCEEEFNQHTWDELVWIATVLGSRGKLLNGLSLGDHIHVKEIPDFVVGSPYGRDYLKLADYLNKSATNLRTVARETQKSSFEIAGFYNACTILHLVKPADAAEQTELENWNTISSSELERAFAPLGKDLKGPISIVVAGALGDGENNVLSTLSDCLTAEAGADNALAPKQKHDFAMDYGEIFFRRDLRVHLYGVHEHSAYQSRAFLEIMGQAMCEKAWGLLILLDSAEEDPVIKLEYYLKCYGKYLAKLNVAIGVINDGHELSKTSVHVLEYISRQALQFPIVDVNPRNPFDMRGLLKALTCNALDTGVCHDIHSDNPLFGCRC
jgi:signal recognition particle receptor subunit beta